MSTGSILSILAYPQYGYHLVSHMGLSLVHCSYLSVGSLHSWSGQNIAKTQNYWNITAVRSSIQDQTLLKLPLFI